ncbi:hypothetical protein BOTBODRAFT_187754 [Botryobasidium botryosum FD-172 SS1]|uniref:Manganese/iron superoxide dismutase C-terminal domain-containing protein n=1 Tax=Botryobasidium botryosum (strain FD-172 SS1) TaxID=930990 RepID=A0A067MGV2_BOTB1|nr:hypothetical protein BOTBODRAFT_187754 [Botryobasidium botryosum FD-172 SS1]
MSCLAPTRSVLFRSRLPTAVSRRCIHQLPTLPYKIENGLGDFLSPAALRTVAVEYQSGLLANLNELVKDTDLENKSIVQTVLSTARDPAKVLTFNHACQALNNSFFLDNLKPPSGRGSTIPPDLSNSIIKSFGSPTALKSSLSAAVTGMSGSGWVWLVCDQRTELGVVATYGPSTLLARTRMQVAASAGRAAYNPNRSVGSNTVQVGNVTPGALNYVGQSLVPLLCVSVHEHAWLLDYGVWGKEEYMRRFWDVVNWDKVDEILKKFVRPDFGG